VSVCQCVLVSVFMRVCVCFFRVDVCMFDRVSVRLGECVFV
jgi:hypothetical protein